MCADLSTAMTAHSYVHIKEHIHYRTPDKLNSVLSREIANPKGWFWRMLHEQEESRNKDEEIKRLQEQLTEERSGR